MITDTVQAVIDEKSPPAIADIGEVVRRDIHDIIDFEKQLSSPDQVGSGLTDAVPQEGRRVKQLLYMGRPRPWTPRWNTGLMVSSVTSDMVERTKAVVSMGGFNEQIAIGQQEGNAGYRMFGEDSGPIPARPFFGVSDRALKLAEARKEQLGLEIQAALDDKVETVSITLRV